MQSNEKEVFYNLYCNTCVYYTQVDADRGSVPKCEDCQSTPMNVDSHKPVNYKEVSK